METSVKSKELRFGDPGFMRDYSADSQAALEYSTVSPSVLLSFLQATPDCVKIVNCDGQLEFMNANGMCAMEIDDFAPLKGAEWSSLWPEEDRNRVMAAVRNAAAGKSERFEAFCPTAKGTDRWWDVTVTPILTPDGQVSRILSVSRDVTALKLEQLAAQQHAEDLEDDLLLNQEMLDMQTTMMRAIDHRVRNSLSIVAGMLRMQARTTGETGISEALNRAAGRTHTAASLKELIYSANRLNHTNTKNFLPQLARKIVTEANDTGIELTTQTESVDMDFSQATALGLILSEALGNAVSHGRGGAPVASIRIRFGRDRTGSLRLDVEDDGPGLPKGFDPDAGPGIGLKIISLYAEQLGGTAGLQRGESGGAHFTLEYPEL